MKLKKSLLALTTAATVAVAGSTAAVAQEAPTAGGSSTPIANGDDKNDSEPGKEPTDKEKQKKERQEKLAGSANKYFDWDENTSGLKKLTTVVTLITTVAALVGGIVSLFTNFQKLGKLAK